MAGACGLRTAPPNALHTMKKLHVLVLLSLAAEYALAKDCQGDKGCGQGLRPNRMPTSGGLELGTRPTSEFLGGAAAPLLNRSTLSRRLASVTYEEGSVINIDYNRNWFHSEEEAR